MSVTTGWVTVIKQQRMHGLYLVRKKVVETKTPHLYKLIIQFVNCKKSGTALFLVRDGFIVKPCRPKDRRHLVHAYESGYKKSIRSKNLGALFKKYSIPKSTGKILVEHTDRPILSAGHFYNIHTVCRKYKDLLTFFHGSIENLNKVITVNPYFYRQYQSFDFTEISKHLSEKRRLDLFSSVDYIRDIMWAYQNIESTCPELLVGFDWTQSIKEIHDSLSLLEKKRKNPRLYNAIPYVENTIEDVRLTNELLGGQLQLKLAENGAELAMWGNHLSHCIGTYANQALANAQNESLILLGVFEPEKDMPTWCIEMRRSRGVWVIFQFRGLYNSIAPEETINLVTKELNNAAKQSVLSYSS